MDTVRHTDHEIYFIDEECIDLSIQGTVYFMSLDTGSAYKILRDVVSSGISIGDWGKFVGEIFDMLTVNRPIVLP